jgi:hypothetical protein
MRFALLGDHPDGLDMARALVLTGRHELRAYSGPQVGAERLKRWDLRCRLVQDMEEVLADPSVDAVIVAGDPGIRATQLRRSLQSERHVLCVHPVDHSPDIGYEAAMLQADTGYLLFPLLPDALHPALARLAEVAGLADPAGRSFRLIELERWSAEAVLFDSDIEGHQPGLPGWDVLRFLVGEIAEVSAFAVSEDPAGDEPMLVNGRFERGGLFQMVLVPGQAEALWRLAVVTASGRVELLMPRGWPGPASLRWHNEAGELCEESWDAWNPWPALVEALEADGNEQVSGGRKQTAAGNQDLPEVAGSEAIQAKDVASLAPPADCLRPAAYRPTWHDATRCLELDDAARRSIERRRTSIMEYQEATEEAGFKGTMTLVGCGLLWASLFLLILSAWIPWLGWAILPVFGVFLVLQLFRWIVPAAAEGSRFGLDDRKPTS